MPEPIDVLAHLAEAMRRYDMLDAALRGLTVADVAGLRVVYAEIGLKFHPLTRDQRDALLASLALHCLAYVDTGDGPAVTLRHGLLRVVLDDVLTSAADAGTEDNDDEEPVDG